MDPATETLTPPAAQPDGEDVIVITAEDGRTFRVPREVVPSVEDLVIEDDTPVERLLFEMLMRLLTESLYSSWPGPGDGRTFLAVANVGLFYAWKKPPLVPDVMLSLDVQPGDLKIKENNSYFTWLFGKPPDVVFEFVLDRRGGEDTHKLREYAQIGVPYYVIYDPDNLLRGGELRAFGLRHGRYEAIDPCWFDSVGLGLMFWEGVYAGNKGVWLRWCDREGHPIPTGREQAEQALSKTEQARTEVALARTEAEQARKTADEERQRSERLQAQLRALGKEPS
jgi:hypothetical protein